ncbi:hypothetical protein [Streptomyces sp. S3(2020)]|nr:hypothetical protein [Streptomyces sp. S3(2020)]
MPSVSQQFDLYDGHPVQIEQQRRIADQARGSRVIVLLGEEK